MYGSTMGIIKARLVDDSNTLWVKSGNQGNKWHEDEFTVISTRPFQIIFTAIRGSGYTGDSALDNFVLKPGACRK